MLRYLATDSVDGVTSRTTDCSLENNAQVVIITIIIIIIFTIIITITSIGSSISSSSLMIVRTREKQPTLESFLELAGAAHLSHVQRRLACQGGGKVELRLFQEELT